MSPRHALSTQSSGPSGSYKTTVEASISGYRLDSGKKEKFLPRFCCDVSLHARQPLEDILLPNARESGPAFYHFGSIPGKFWIASPCQELYKDVFLVRLPAEPLRFWLLWARIGFYARTEQRLQTDGGVGFF
jgi:hypothetical protein